MEVVYVQNLFYRQPWYEDYFSKIPKIPPGVDTKSYWRIWPLSPLKGRSCPGQREEITAGQGQVAFVMSRRVRENYTLVTKHCHTLNKYRKWKVANLASMSTCIIWWSSVSVTTTLTRTPGASLSLSLGSLWWSLSLMSRPLATVALFSWPNPTDFFITGSWWLFGSLSLNDLTFISSPRRFLGDAKNSIRCEKLWSRFSDLGRTFVTWCWVLLLLSPSSSDLLFQNPIRLFNFDMI